MENLKEKLKKDAESVDFQEGTGLPVEVLIMYAVNQAQNNNQYKEKLENENFAATLLYMCEWFLKEIVESEMTGKCAYVSDEITFKALDTWILASEDERKELLSVLTEVKHPRSGTHNPFIKSNFFTKDNLDKIVEHFKQLPIMEMLIKKYYKEPKPATTTKKSTTVTKKATKKANQKSQSEQISLDMFESLMGNTAAEKENDKEDNENLNNKEETPVVSTDSVAEEIVAEEVVTESADASEKTVSEETKDTEASITDVTEETEKTAEKEVIVPESEPEPVQETPKQIDLFSLF